jgi:hypothetical protein
MSKKIIPTMNKTPSPPTNSLSMPINTATRKKKSPNIMWFPPQLISDRSKKPSNEGGKRRRKKTIRKRRM